MNWDKAKNYTILFFVILNMALGFLIYNGNSKYILTKEQESAIMSVLGKNKIIMYTQIISKFEPRKQITMQKYTYDLEAVSELFFKNPKGAKKTVEVDKTVLASGNETLTLQDGYLIYKNTDGTGAITFDKNGAQVLCDKYIKRAGKDFKGFSCDVKIPTDNGWYLQYRQTFKGSLIYDNCIEFLVSEKGIMRAEISYSVPLGFSGNKRDIYGADEALFMFMKQKEYGNMDVFINQMDLVYHQEEVTTEEDVSINAIPYYRIYISGVEEPFLIKAFLNNAA